MDVGCRGRGSRDQWGPEAVAEAVRQWDSGAVRQLGSGKHNGRGSGAVRQRGRGSGAVAVGLWGSGAEAVRQWQRQWGCEAVGVGWGSETMAKTMRQ